MKYENIKTGDIIDIPYKIKDDNFKPVEDKKQAPKKEPRKTKE
ncbi:hypothetical protein ACQUEU_00685 [Enterococcus casseliflavus]